MPIDTKSLCKFCGKEDFLVVPAKERMLQLSGEFQYRECLSCGSLQLIDIPKDLANYYPKESYYSQAPLVYSSRLKNLLKSIRLEVFRILPIPFFSPSYGEWLRKLRPKKQDRIADIGCGNGQLLYEMYASGFRKLEGFDPYIPETKKINDSLQLFCESFESAKGTFDLIMMHHSFEHMEDPESILKVCFQKLKAGGKLLVRTPVTDSQVWKEKKELWVQLDAPRHLVIPSVQGFSQLSEEIGFQLDEVVFDSTAFQFWGTALYEKGKALNPDLVQSLFTDSELKEMHKKALQYNQEGKGDQVCFYLIKPIKS